jgi:hypothetical protein
MELALALGLALGQAMGLAQEQALAKIQGPPKYPRALYNPNQKLEPLHLNKAKNEHGTLKSLSTEPCMY